MAVIAIGVMSAVFTLLGSIRTVAEITDFASFLIFIAINSAVIILRYREPANKRPFRMPLNIGRFPLLPAFGVVFNIAMLFYFSTEVVIGSVIVAAIGAAVYLFTDYRKFKA